MTGKLGSIPGRARYVPLVSNIQTGSGTYPGSCLVEIRVLSLEVKRSGHYAVTHSCPVTELRMCGGMSPLPFGIGIS